jgi:hypothetical protein
MKPETRFRNQKVIPFLKTLKNCYYEGIQQKSKSGSPDFYLCINGYFLALELKDRSGVISYIQGYTLGQIENKGKGIAIVSDQDDWEGVKAILTLIDNGEKYDSTQKKTDWQSRVPNRTTKANAS